MGHTAHDKQAANTMGMVILAAAAGALAALLFAPKRGEEMREDLNRKYNDMMRKTHDSVDTAKDRVAETTETMRTKAHDVADRAKSTVDMAADKAKDAADKAADKAKDSADETAARARRTPRNP